MSWTATNFPVEYCAPKNLKKFDCQRWRLNISSHQGISPVHLQNHHIDWSGVVSHTNSVTFGTVLLVVKADHGWERPTQDSESSQSCVLIQPSTRCRKGNQTDYCCHYCQINHLEILGFGTWISDDSKCLTPTARMTALPGRRTKYLTKNPIIHMTVSLMLTNSKLWLVLVNKFQLWKKKVS